MKLKWFVEGRISHLLKRLSSNELSLVLLIVLLLIRLKNKKLISNKISKTKNRIIHLHFKYSNFYFAKFLSINFHV